MLIVVTGNPGVGKSTLARRLADELGLPLVAKDPIKERLGDIIGWTDRASSQRLGHATMLVLFDLVDELLRSGVSLIAESNFYGIAAERLRAGLADAPSGTQVVQVLVECAPSLAAERFKARVRHPVHVLGEIGELPPLQPLDLPGALVRVDSTDLPVDLTPILEAVNRG